MPAAAHCKEYATVKDAVKPGSERVAVVAADTTAGDTVASTTKVLSIGADR